VLALAELAERPDASGSPARCVDGGPQMPFGGVKASGYGREMGRAGLEEHTELKSCVIRTGPREPFFAQAAANG
jgi:Aldehyde dehydrogenase family